MKNGMLEIDHLLTSVDDPVAAGEEFERLGFTVSPISIITTMGLANRLILMDPKVEGAANFIEFMGVWGKPEDANPAMSSLLEGPQGIRSIVLATPDAHAAREELLANGIDPGPVFHVERRWTVSEDDVMDIVYDVILPYRSAPLAFNLCQYQTLHHYLRADWRVHPNGARHFAAVHCIASDPSVSDYYARLFGQPARPSRFGTSAMEVSPGEVSLCLHDETGFADWSGIAVTGREGYVGYSVEVENLDATRRYLTERGVTFVDRGEQGVFLRPEAARGCVLHFCENA